VPLSAPGLGSPAQLSNTPHPPARTSTSFPSDTESLRGFLLLGTEIGVVGIGVGLFGGTVYSELCFPILEAKAAQQEPRS